MVNQQLINYIKTEEAQGYTPQQLRNYLIQQGYNPSEVDEAINYANARNIYQFSQPTQQFQTSQNVSSKERPVAITIIAILYFISGGFTLINSIINLIRGQAAAASIPIIGGFLGGFIIGFSIFGLAMGAINLLVGYGLWTLKNWARIIAIIGSVLICLTIIGIPIGAIFIWLLVKKDTKEAFGVA
jgi:hypothetical protein